MVIMINLDLFFLQLKTKVGIYSNITMEWFTAKNSYMKGYNNMNIQNGYKDLYLYSASTFIGTLCKYMPMKKNHK